MKKLIRFPMLLCLAACFFIIQSCSTENELDAITISANESAEANSTMRPFKATFSTFHAVSPTSVFPVQIIEITGEGQASHLGKTSLLTNTTLTITSSPPFITSGTTIMTAANGDELHSSFSGTAVPQQDGRMLVIVHHTVTGGTGRFSDASGSYTATAYSIPGAVTGSVSFAGEIAY